MAYLTYRVVMKGICRVSNFEQVKHARTSVQKREARACFGNSEILMS